MGLYNSICHDPRGQSCKVGGMTCWRNTSSDGPFGFSDPRWLHGDTRWQASWFLAHHTDHAFTIIYPFSQSQKNVSVISSPHFIDHIHIIISRCGCVCVFQNFLPGNFSKNTCAIFHIHFSDSKSQGIRRFLCRSGHGGMVTWTSEVWRKRIVQDGTGSMEGKFHPTKMTGNTRHVS